MSASVWSQVELKGDLFSGYSKACRLSYLLLWRTAWSFITPINIFNTNRDHFLVFIVTFRNFSCLNLVCRSCNDASNQVLFLLRREGKLDLLDPMVQKIFLVSNAFRTAHYSLGRSSGLLQLLCAHLLLLWFDFVYLDGKWAVAGVARYDVELCWQLCLLIWCVERLLLLVGGSLEDVWAVVVFDSRWILQLCGGLEGLQRGHLQHSCTWLFLTFC